MLKLEWTSPALCVYSATFMRFAWMVIPRNLLLLACHVCNESIQLYQLSRKLRSEVVEELAVAGKE